MRWTWSSIIGAILVLVAALLMLFTSHKQSGILLNTIGLIFLFIYSRKYGKRVNAPFDHEGLHLF